MDEKEMKREREKLFLEKLEFNVPNHLMLFG